MKRKNLICLLGTCLLLSVFAGCGRKPDAIDTPELNILTSESSELPSEKEPLTAYPEHKNNTIKTISGILTVDEVVEASPGNDEVERIEYPFTYFGNEEFGYEVVPNGFEKVDDTTYRKEFEEGAFTVTIDGYEKGDYSFDEWISLITDTYGNELNFAEETKTGNYAMYSFNPNDDLTKLSLVEITDDDTYIHIDIITVEGIDPNETVEGLYPYGHFDYEPISFLDELGQVKFNENQ